MAQYKKPKSEVEKLQEMLDAAIAGQETLQKALAKEKTEVARLQSQINRLKRYDEIRDVQLHQRIFEAGRRESESLRVQNEHLTAENKRLQNLLNDLMKDEKSHND